MENALKWRKNEETKRPVTVLLSPGECVDVRNIKWNWQTRRLADVTFLSQASSG